MIRLSKEEKKIVLKRSRFLEKRDFVYLNEEEFGFTYANKPIYASPTYNCEEGIEFFIFWGRHADEQDIYIAFFKDNHREMHYLSWLVFFHDNRRIQDLKGKEKLLYLLDFIEKNFAFVTNSENYSDINARYNEYQRSLPPTKFNPDTGKYELI